MEQVSEPCTGSGHARGYTPAKVTATSDATGKPSYAKVTCPACSREFNARIIRSQQGVDLGPAGVVLVPRHRAAQKV